MSRVYLQCDTPKYEALLPARAVAIPPGEDREQSYILWEAYIDHRISQPVYFATSAERGKWIMLRESCINGSSVKKINIVES
jgi:hypothetical protein